MQPRILSIVIALLFSALSVTIVHGQATGINASAIWLSDCNQSDYFNVNGIHAPSWRDQLLTLAHDREKNERRFENGRKKDSLKAS